MAGAHSPSFFIGSCKVSSPAHKWPLSIVGGFFDANFASSASASPWQQTCLRNGLIGATPMGTVLDGSVMLAHNEVVGQTGAASRGCTDTASGMPEFFRHPLLHAALWFAAIFALMALAILVARRWRGDSAEDRPTASELLTKFRELRVRGSLSEDEYRTIKTKLATQIGTALNDTEKTS